MSSSSCASDEVYHVVTKKCVPKSSKAGKILSNPKNKRCKDDKVINPKTNHCADPKGATMRPLLMDKDSKEEKQLSSRNSKSSSHEFGVHSLPTRLDYMLRYWKYHSYTSVFPKHKTYLDAKEDRDFIVNGLIAVYRLYTSWSKGALKTNTQVEKAKQDFDMLQAFAQRFPKTISSPRSVTKSFSNIQRVEFEEPSVASFEDFEIIFRTLLEKLLHYKISTKATKEDAKMLAWEADYFESSTSDEIIIMH